jgi:hypothetical protein
MEILYCGVCGMTADYFPFPHEFLGRMAIRGIKRVIYDVTSNPRGRSSGSRGIGGISVGSAG